MILLTVPVVAALSMTVAFRFEKGACSVLDAIIVETCALSNHLSLNVEFEKGTGCLKCNEVVALGPSNCCGFNDVEFLKLKGAACVDESRMENRGRKCIDSC